MDLTLDYNIELYPLKAGQSFALALASSLVKGAQGGEGAGGEDEEKDRDVWRPDGKGRRGLEEDYEYVMYGKVWTSLPPISGLFRSSNHCWLIFVQGLPIRRGHRRDRVGSSNSLY